MNLIPNHFDWKSVPFAKAYYPAIGIILYLTTIFSLRAFMKNRSPIKIKYLIFIHNVFLCVLSTFMGFGIMIEVVRTLFNNPLPPSSSFSFADSSVREVLCDSTGKLMNGRMAFWMYIFYLSKYYEFVDTIIMVLTKRRLNFLHVYHHCIVLPLFYVYMSTDMILQWIIVVANCFVHVAMYYYYAMSSMGFKIWWKKYITMAQIIQFIIDLTSTWPYPMLYFSAKGCSGSMRAWLFGQAVGFSFFKLFTDFYTKSYKKDKNKSSTTSLKDNQSESQKNDLKEKQSQTNESKQDDSHQKSS